MEKLPTPMVFTAAVLTLAGSLLVRAGTIAPGEYGGVVLGTGESGLVGVATVTVGASGKGSFSCRSGKNQTSLVLGPDGAGGLAGAHGACSISSTVDGWLTGSVNLSGATVPLALRNASPVVDSGVEGQYTLLFEGSSQNSSESVPVIGTGVATVSESGKVLFNGILADGSVISQTTKLDSASAWNFYATSKTGTAIAGKVTFTDSGNADCSGFLMAAAAIQGEATITVLGSKYTPALGFDNENESFSFSDRSAGNALLTQVTTLAVKGDTLYSGVDPVLGWGLLNQPSGAVSGAVVQAGQLTVFEGVVYQKLNAVFGLTLSGPTTGLNLSVLASGYQNPSLRNKAEAVIGSVLKNLKSAKSGMFEMELTAALAAVTFPQTEGGSESGGILSAGAGPNGSLPAAGGNGSTGGTSSSTGGGSIYGNWPSGGLLSSGGTLSMTGGGSLTSGGSVTSGATLLVDGSGYNGWSGISVAGAGTLSLSGGGSLTSSWPLGGSLTTGATLLVDEGNWLNGNSAYAGSITSGATLTLTNTNYYIPITSYVGGSISTNSAVYNLTVTGTGAGLQTAGSGLSGTPGLLQGWNSGYGSTNSGLPQESVVGDGQNPSGSPPGTGRYPIPDPSSASVTGN